MESLTRCACWIRALIDRQRARLSFDPNQDLKAGVFGGNFLEKAVWQGKGAGLKERRGILEKVDMIAKRCNIYLKCYHLLDYSYGNAIIITVRK